MTAQKHTPEQKLANTLSRWRSGPYRDVMLPGAPGTTTAGDIVDAIDAFVTEIAGALASARSLIEEDRDEIFDCVTVAGIEATMEEIDRPSVERLDAILHVIDAAISRAEEFR